MSEYVELFMDQGAAFSTTITINDETTGLAQNLSGYVVSSQMRRSVLSQNATATFSCSTVPANGEITVALDGGNTANIVAGTYFFDVRLRDGYGVYSRLVEGVIFVNPSITR
jgi:hypothetical protein